MDRKRLLLLVVIIAAIAAFFIFDLKQYFSIEYFQASRLGGGLLVFEGAFFVGSLACAAFLWRARTPGLRVLRTIEMSIVTLFSVKSAANIDN